ncbi:MAG: hypothetical protein MUP69_07055 [Candidatus Atribacteria bacterium]|nr:hypothetical protein [Candidatus Atribacteria bacterium]
MRYEAHLQYGYTLKEIAEYISLHYSTVSKRLEKLRGKMKSDIARSGSIIMARIYWGKLKSSGLTL